MKHALILLAAVLLTGCGTLNSLGIGGEPKNTCANGVASIDDRIAGSDQVRVSVIRRFRDGDKLCSP